MTHVTCTRHCQEPGSAPEPYAQQSCVGYVYLLLPSASPSVRPYVRACPDGNILPPVCHRLLIFWEQVFGGQCPVFWQHLPTAHTRTRTVTQCFWTPHWLMSLLFSQSSVRRRHVILPTADYGGWVYYGELSSWQNHQSRPDDKWRALFHTWAINTGIPVDLAYTRALLIASSISSANEVFVTCWSLIDATNGAWSVSSLRALLSDHQSKLHSIWCATMTVMGHSC